VVLLTLRADYQFFGLVLLIFVSFFNAQRLALCRKSEIYVGQLAKFRISETVVS